MLTFHVNVCWYNWKLCCNWNQNCIFWICLGLRHSLAGCLCWQQEVWECQGCSCRAAASPAPFWERVEAPVQDSYIKCVCVYFQWCFKGGSLWPSPLCLCWALWIAFLKALGMLAQRWFVGFSWVARKGQKISLPGTVALGQAPCWKRLENSRVFMNDWGAWQVTPNQNWHSCFILINDRLGTSPTEI